MKKFIKKTVAGLIASVMAISSMPLTALAATDLDNAKSALSSFNYSGITTQEGNWYNSSNSKMSMPSETYANLLFAGDSKADYGAFTNSSDSTKGYLRYQKSVFLYDDITTPRAPIMVVYGATKDANRYIGAITLSDNQNNALKLIGNWKCSRKNNYGNNWDYPNVWAMNGSDDIQPGIDVNNPTSAQIAGSAFLNNWNVQPGMANKMEYQGTFAEDTYTQDITLTVDFYQGGNSGQLGNVHDTIVGTEKCYAVNYKAVLDTIKTAKTDISSVSYDKYTEASVNVYANAVTALTSFNPTTNLSFSADSLESDVSNAGTTIKTLVDNYNKAKDNLEIKKYTYTFISSDGTRTTYEAQDDSTAYFWGVTSHNAKETADTAKTYAGDNQHSWFTYSYPTEATNYEFVEKGEQKFEACDVVDHVCTICGNKTIDYDTLNSAIAAAKATYDENNADGKYTAESFATFKAAYDAATAKVNNAESQTDADDTAKALITAQNELERENYEVKFYTVSANDSTLTLVDGKPSYITYGNTFEANAKSNVAKWIVETDNGNTTTVLNSFDKSVSVVITKDAAIYAYLSDEEQTETSSKVTFLGKNGQVVAVRYIAEGYTLNTSDVELPSVPFYTTTGWDTETVIGDGKDYTVNAVFTCNQAEDDMCTVHFGDWSKKYSYDSYVYLFNADKTKKYALYSDEACTQLLTYIDGVDFYAPKTKDIYVAEVTEQVASIGITGTFVETTDSAKSAVYNCKFFVPEDAEVVEWGLEVTLNGQTANVKAEKRSSRNEYSVRLNAPTSFSGEISGRAYVVYKVGNEKITKYSTAVNQTL